VKISTSGIGLAHHHGTRGLDDARLLRCDVREGRAGELGVVEPDVGDDRHLGLDQVGGVPPAEQTDLDHGHVHGHVGEPAERGGGHRLEVAGPHAGEHLEFGDSTDLFGELLVADRFTVARDALVDPFEVWAGVGAHGEALRHQQLGDHLHRRPLAVGAGDMDHRRREMGIAHGSGQARDRLERR
jgi:hypothetical protein